MGCGLRHFETREDFYGEEARAYYTQTERIFMAWGLALITPRSATSPMKTPDPTGFLVDDFDGRATYSPAYYKRNGYFD